MTNDAQVIRQLPGPLRSIVDIIAELSRPVAARHLKTRKQGGNEITFIEWPTAVKYLDHLAPGWSFEIRSVQQIGDKCVVVARITIPAAEGAIWREATGQEDIAVSGWGDSSSNAEAMALKRAAAKFGLGISLYQKH
jgi:hypothetical protein